MIKRGYPTSHNDFRFILYIFAICEYFDISPTAFFDSKHSNPELLSKAIEEIQSLDDEDMLIILTLIKRIKK